MVHILANIYCMTAHFVVDQGGNYGACTLPSHASLDSGVNEYLVGQGLVQ